MSKRVQRFECDECGESYRDQTGAVACERHHREDREREECDKLWTKLDDERYLLTADQIRQLIALVKTWQSKESAEPGEARTPTKEP